MRNLIWLFFLLPIVAGAETDATSYQPLDFLVGHCWIGTFPDGKQTDEHCFTWIYDRKFVRDVHVVRGGGRPEHGGESIYFYDAVSKKLEYLYVESDGGFSRGAVTADGNTLIFPPTSYTEGGKTMTYRSRWVQLADTAYDATTEFQAKDAWVPGFKFHMERK